MSPNNKQRARGGFTLVETLVAVSIFLVVISGVFALFTGAVSTTLSGYQQMDGVGLARTTLKVLEDDLTVAYTGREFGDPNQFYGRPEGFMVVGKLSTGAEGRVTYVINPNASAESFQSELFEPWQETLERACRQAWEAGYAAAIARGLDADLATDAGVRVAANMKTTFEALYPAPLNTSEPYEFPVIVSTYSLLRYEEPNRRDLDSFDLPDPAMYWPYIDPVYPAKDNPSNPSENTPTGRLYQFLLSGIGGPKFDGDFNGDMREMTRLFLANNPSSYDAPQAQLHAIDPTIIKTLLDAKKREYWIRLLADDPEIAGTRMPRFWTNDPAETDKRLITDYVLTEKILNHAALINPATGQLFTFFANDPAAGNVSLGVVDALKVPGIFNYGFNKSDFAELDLNSGNLNTVERMPGYTKFISNRTPGDLKNFDDVLNGALANGGNSPVWAGTPLVPRLPAIVQVRFWIADEKVLPNAVDFRRLFTQLMDVPAGGGPASTSTQTAQGAT